jgi:integrase
MGVYERDGRWMVYFRHEGKRRDKSFGRGKEGYNQAVAFDEAMKGQKRVMADPLVTALPSPAASQTSTQSQSSAPHPILATARNLSAGMTLLELTDRYIDHLKASGRSDSHIRSIDLHVKKQFLPVLGNKVIDSMSYAHDMLRFIRHFQEVSDRTGRKRSKTTVNRYTDYLNAIFNFGMEMGLTKTNPMKGRRKSKERPREVQISLDDLKNIMEHADKHVQWAIEVCFNLGLRPGKSELFSIRYDQIDWTAPAIRVYASKTQTTRVIPISPIFAKKLKVMEAQSKSGFVIEYLGKPVTRMNKAYQAACVRAGIKVPTRMYDLRHLFATTMLSRGADLAAVSKLMGHSKVTMTADTYYQYLQGEKERAISLLPII